MKRDMAEQTIKTCAIDGCNIGGQMRRGMCKKHYDRWHTVNRVSPGDPCAADGCVRLAKSRGWCQTHYVRWLRHGDHTVVLQNLPQPKTPCSIDGCDRPTRARGWCNLHWTRWRNNGDPELVLPSSATATGEKSANWAGADITYRGMHLRVRTNRGLATLHACVHCGVSARQWAYDHNDPDERIGDTGRGRLMPFSVNIEHYIPLCLSCHWRFDRAPSPEP